MSGSLSLMESGRTGPVDGPADEDEGCDPEGPCLDLCQVVDHPALQLCAWFSLD